MELTDQVYAEIGRIAVNAAGLEERIVMLLVLVSGNRGNPDELIQKPSKVVRDALRRAADEHAEPELGREVTEWLSEAEELLKTRNSLIHAEWVNVVGVNGGEIPTALHSKSGSMIPAEYIRGLHLAQRIREAWEAGGPLANRAAIHAGVLRPS